MIILVPACYQFLADSEPVSFRGSPVSLVNHKHIDLASHRAGIGHTIAFYGTALNETRAELSLALAVEVVWVCWRSTV